MFSRFALRTRNMRRGRGESPPTNYMYIHDIWYLIIYLNVRSLVQFVYEFVHQIKVDFCKLSNNFGK